MNAPIEIIFRKSLSLSRIKGVLLVAASCVLLLLFVYFLVPTASGDSHSTDGIVMVIYGYFMIFLLFAVPGSVLLIVGLVFLLRTGNLTVTRSDVVCEITRALRGPRFWTEPVASYRGVLLQELHGGGEGGGVSRYIERRLELSHDDPCKCVRLEISRDDDGTAMLKLCRQFARSLGLPALREHSDGIEEIEAAPQSLSNFDNQNSGDTVYEIDESSVPAQVQVVNCRNAIELEFGHQRNPVLPMMACVVFGIVLIAIGAIVYDGVGLIVCGSIFISITVFVLLVLQFTSVRLSITSHSINEVHIYPRGSSVLQELPTENIFELYLADRYDGIKGDGNLALHIAGEEGEMVVGRGLPRETLEWIKECVLCVIAGDDEPE